MYSGTYDDYIRSILGYPINNNSNSNYNKFNMENNNYNMRNNNYLSDVNTGIENTMQINQKNELEKCYPEIYKIINPMIVKRCENVRGNVSSEDIENMTDEIYNAIESTREINLNINLTNNVRSSNTNSNQMDKTAKVTMKEIKAEESKSEKRQFNNGLRDLIKILLIRQLLNNRQENRPPFPPRPNQNPSSGIGPRPPMRPPYGAGTTIPPFNRNSENSMYDIYEN
jgi:hypothetical protein